LDFFIILFIAWLIFIVLKGKGNKKITASDAWQSQSPMSASDFTEKMADPWATSPKDEFEDSFEDESAYAVDWDAQPNLTSSNASKPTQPKLVKRANSWRMNSSLVRDMNNKRRNLSSRRNKPWLDGRRIFGLLGAGALLAIIVG